MKVKRSKVMYRRNVKLKKSVILILVLAALLAAGWALSGPVSKLLSRPAESSSAVSAAPQSAPETPVSTPAGPSSAPTGVLTPPAVADDSFKAVSPPQSDLADLTRLAAFCASAKANGADTVIIDIKDETGRLLYRSVGLNAGASDAAIYANISQRADADLSYTAYDRLEELVAVIKNSGLRAYARLNCFNDSVSGRSIPGSRCTISGSDGTTWLDDSVANGGRSWLNPYSRTARRFAVEIARDCKTFGFDALIADYVQFPVGFSLGRIDYGADAAGIDRTAALSGFVEELIARSGLPVWLTVRNCTPEGSQEFGGSAFALRPEGLAGYLAVLNAPENPHKDSPAALDDTQLAAAAASIPQTDGRPVVCAVIAQQVPAALSALEKYAVLNGKDF